ALAAVLAADVDDVAEPVAHGALRDRAPEVGAEAEEEHAEIVRRVAVARELAQHDESPAVKDFIPPGGDVAGDGLEGEILRGEVFRGAAGVTVAGEGPVERGQVGAGERERIRIRGRE